MFITGPSGCSRSYDDFLAVLFSLWNQAVRLSSSWMAGEEDGDNIVIHHEDTMSVFLKKKKEKRRKKGKSAACAAYILVRTCTAGIVKPSP